MPTAAGLRKRLRRTSKPAVNPSRVHLRERMRAFAGNTADGMLVLDAGAGHAPYRNLFKHARYEAADFAQLSSKYTQLDYVCDLTAIPVDDGRFDRVVFNQVLEHMPEPARTLAELNRVLKPGGELFCSVPLFYAEHQVPYDFYRYTQFALRRLFTEAGFEVVSLDWLEGYFGTISYQFQMMHRHLPRDVATVRGIAPGWRAVYLAPLLLLTRFAAGHLEKAYSKADVRWTWKGKGKGMPKNYVVIAKKPSAPSAKTA